MKTRNYGLFLRLAALFTIASSLQAQIRPWEQNVQVQVSNPVVAFTADGYGLQVITNPGGTSFEHYLIGHDGQVISANSGNVHPTRITDFGVSITNNAGIVSVVFDTAGNKLVLHQSTNGGVSWTRKGSYTPTGHTVRNIDAFAETRSGKDMVHIVWDTDTGDTVFYVRYEGSPTNGFVSFQTITDIGGITGRNPKVVTSSNRIHVSLVTTNDSQNKRGTMRDFVFSSGQWESTYRQTNTISSLVYPIVQENAGVRNNGTTDSIHLVMQENNGGLSTYSIHSSRRKVDGNWGGNENNIWISNGSDDPGSNRRRVTSVGDTLYTVFNRNSDSNGGIKFSEYKASSGWSSPYTIASQNNFDYLNKATIASSRTGVYVVWETHTYGEVNMARKALALSGHITENMFFTDSNWVTGDLTIDAGYTVTLKAGSITFVSDNKKIIVENGARLLKERGSQIVWGSGAMYQLNTSLLDAWNMTGIPVVLANTDTFSVYPTRASNVFEFNSGYNIVSSVATDRGYWVKFGSAQPHVYEGGFIDYMEMNAYNGWNIIGSISCPIDTSLVETDPPGSRVTSFFKYNNGYQLASILEPGGGYWVKTNAEGKIILNLGSDGDAGRGIPRPLSKLNGDEPSSLDTYDRFTVTDAVGRRQHLYVRNASLAGTTENIEMPPPLPDNSFDVRFAPGDFLQSVIPDSEGIDLSIALNAVTYPAELSWEINPDNGLTYLMLPDSGTGLGKGNSPKNIRGSSSAVMSSRGNGFVRFNVSNRQVAEINTPAQFALQQNYPNPFNPSTVISYDLSIDSKVTLKVYDVLGREVATLVNGFVEAGSHQTVFNATTLASGVYLYRLQSGSFTATKKFLLLR